MKSLRLKIIALIAIVVTFQIFTIASISANGTTKFENIDYTNLQLNDDELINMALEGFPINNYHTKTDIKNGEITEITIKKVLSENKIADEIISVKSKEIKTIVVYQDAFNKFDFPSNQQETIQPQIMLTKNSNVKTQNSTYSFLAYSQGSASRTGQDASITCKMTTTMYWDTWFNSNGSAHDRVTSATYKATLLDSQFKLVSIDSSIGYMGSGYNYSPSTNTYTATPYTSVSTTFTKSNPISNTTYSKSTGFNFFKLEGIGLGGTNSSLSFQRISGGTIYTLTLPQVPLP